MQYSTFALLIILSLSTFTFLPNIAIADNSWKIYKVSHEGQTFKIPVKITNGEVKEVAGHPEFDSVIVSIETSIKSLS